MEDENNELIMQNEKIQREQQGQIMCEISIAS
jgi:hypothetical protein